jgi:hypothetical protein
MRDFVSVGVSLGRIHDTFIAFYEGYDQRDENGITNYMQEARYFSGTYFCSSLKKDDFGDVCEDLARFLFEHQLHPLFEDNLIADEKALENTPLQGLEQEIQKIKKQDIDIARDTWHKLVS